MSRLSKRAKRRMRGREKQQQPATPTSGYYVLRRGRMFIATSWQFFSNPDFAMKGYAFDRETAIDLFRKATYHSIKPRPDASEFVDYAPAPT